MNERDVFTAALEKEAPAERAAYLDEACAGDAALRRRVEALLNRHEAAGSFLEKAPAACVPDGGPPLPCTSVRQAPGAAVPLPPRVHLRQPPSEPPTPVVRPGSPEMPGEPLPSPPRYQLVGEIARGGMGAILKGHDTDLGRDIAVKVLLAAHKDNSELVRRFVEEAQVGGQLQHPGVVPVYELGQFPDRRPYFTMKLIKGRTLAALLTERPGPGQDRPRFLAMFEQVCQTLAYAHARGVIHRDLKPSNVMVGRFGEVQVMDWGLAKVLAEGGTADEEKASRALTPADSPATAGTAERGGSRTQPGRVMGTPAYMPPEQAQGEVDRLDERSDVFGLGAILCEILTGRPPYGGADNFQVQRRASRGDLADALARLDGCGADAELIALAKRCLAPAPADRPRDAGAVAAEVTAYQHSVAERWRRAELERAAAEARAEEEKKTRQMAEARAAEERKRRRVQLALAGAVLALVVLGGGAAASWWQQRSSRVRDVEAALAEAVTHRQAGRWAEVRAALERAEGRLGGSGPAALRERVRQARADAAMVAEVDEIRLRQAEIREGTIDVRGAEPLYAEAFREYGLDVTALEAGEAAARVRASAIREQLLAALDNWAQSKPAGDPERTKLREVANGADDSGWRRAFRDAADRQRAAKLKELADLAEARDQPPTVLALVGQALKQAGLGEDAAAFLRQAQQRHPGDFWVNFDLAVTLATLRPPQSEAAVGYYRAALAVRPDSLAVLNNLGYELRVLGDVDGALACCRQAVDLDPNLPAAHLNLGVALFDKEDVKGALASYRKAIDLDPKLAAAHNSLGWALQASGDVDGAITCYRRALRLDAKLAPAHNNLGTALRRQRDVDGAIASYRKAVRLDPRFASAYDNLGMALEAKGEVQEALAAYRQAVALRPKSPSPYHNLVLALQAQGSTGEAAALAHQAVFVARLAVDRHPDQAEAHNHLGLALQAQGQLDEAIAAFGKATALKSGYVAALNHLGRALAEKKEFDGAVAALRKAMKHAPKEAMLYYNLGSIRHSQGNLNDAAEAFRTAIGLDESNASFHYNLGNTLADLGRPGDAIACYERAIQVQPGYVSAHINLGMALRARGKLDEALPCFEEAVRLAPRHVRARLHLGGALADKQRLDEALTHYREAARLAPGDGSALYNLGLGLQQKGDLEGAAAAYRQAIVLRPDDAQAYCNLGWALQQQGRFLEALSARRRGHELGSRQPGWRFPSERWVKEAERLVELEVKLPAVLGGKAKPAGADEAVELARVAKLKKLFAAAARLLADAFDAKKELAEDWRQLRRYSAACYAALAGCGRGEDAARLTEKERGRWRKQSLDWLRADLARMTKDVADGKPQDRATAAAVLRHWLRDADLADVRHRPALAKLPETEREAWQRLWKDVQALLDRLSAPPR